MFVSRLDCTNLLLQGFSCLHTGGKANVPPLDFCFERAIEEADTPFSAELPEEEVQAVVKLLMFDFRGGWCVVDGGTAHQEL